MGGKNESNALYARVIMIRAIKSYFSLQHEYCAFRDNVSGKMVSVYRDCYGDLWMKDSRWSLFRVRKCGSI